ncbi:major facilitator superfamily domain-containing protein [Podospora didyma]|uniref:Major facilitator superfamily domain-containing protein n=1 Tax=Podospora didyma TaxID=330526 RepID=A0AAE0TZN0_9PEZI|nr:major facilitator superfamily domain-containing protein [Podospora didyma]
MFAKKKGSAKSNPTASCNDADLGPPELILPPLTMVTPLSSRYPSVNDLGLSVPPSPKIVVVETTIDYDHDSDATLNRLSVLSTSGLPPPPEGGLQAWLTVAGSFCITTAVYGLSNSVGVIQPFWAKHQLSAFPVQSIAWISGANIFLCLFLGVQIGPWFDRFGPRWLLLAGSLIYLSGLLGIGFLPENAGSGGVNEPGALFGLLLFLWGVVMGTGAALCCTVALSVLAHWFVARRGLAAGIVFVGPSIGGIVFPLVLRSTLDGLGWAWSMRILLLIVATLLGLGNVLIKGRIKGKKGSGAVDFSTFKDARFAWTTVGVFMNQFILIAGLGMVPTWATTRGFSSDSTYIIIAIISGGSGFGRLAAGIISDKIGRFNTMIFTTVFSIITTFGVWLLVETYRMWLFYLFAAMFGFGTGCVISVGPICVGQLTKPSKFGQFYGTSYSVVSFSALMCIPLSAVILDGLGTTGFILVFGGVLLIALGAFLMARLAIQGYVWKWKEVI